MNEHCHFGCCLLTSPLRAASLLTLSISPRTCLSGSYAPPRHVHLDRPDVKRTRRPHPVWHSGDASCVRTAMVSMRSPGCCCVAPPRCTSCHVGPTFADMWIVAARARCSSRHSKLTTGGGCSSNDLFADSRPMARADARTPWLNRIRDGQSCG
ncbi:hypothetical protein BD309DRAFT_163093 [Dichomitus squalens]|nr:hypothetical protein BD309DRAFT_163093 [Dichomitus squalens]